MSAEPEVPEPTSLNVTFQSDGRGHVACFSELGGITSGWATSAEVAFALWVEKARNRVEQWDGSPYRMVKLDGDLPAYSLIRPVVRP